MLNELTEYEKNTLFKNFRETIVSESKENFSTIDNFLSGYNADDMLQKRLDLTQSAYCLFSYYNKENLDDIATKLDFSKVNDFTMCFSFSRKLTHVPYIDISNGEKVTFMFSSCDALQSIPNLHFLKVKSFDSLFSSCGKIREVTINNSGNENEVSCVSMFNYCDELRRVYFSSIPKISNCNKMFYYCSYLEEVPSLNTDNCTNFQSMFYDCRYLIEIPSFSVANAVDNGLNSMFTFCFKIEKIHITNISQNLNISYSTKMEREALLEVLGNLKDLTGSTSKKLTLGSTLLAKLTEDDKAIATNKNWTLA